MSEVVGERMEKGEQLVQHRLPADGRVAQGHLEVRGVLVVQLCRCVGIPPVVRWGEELVDYFRAGALTVVKSQ